MTHQRMAVVNKVGMVVNVIVYDPDTAWTPPEGCILVDASRSSSKSPPYEAGAIGDTWDGKTFVRPVETPPPAWWQK